MSKELGRELEVGEFRKMANEHVIAYHLQIAYGLEKMNLFNEANIHRRIIASLQQEQWLDLLDYR